MITQEPITEDLNSRTESRVPVLEYMSTPIENTLVFTRPSGELVNFAVDHEDVTLIAFNTESDGDPTTVQERFTLSFSETKLLRAFLNRPEIVEMLSRQ